MWLVYNGLIGLLYQPHFTMTECIIVLGPDRVGKSTWLENTKTAIKKQNKHYYTKHFSAPPKTDINPLVNFRKALVELHDMKRMGLTFDYALFDRNAPEIALFDKSRRNKITSHKWAEFWEFEWANYFGHENISIYINYKPWEWSEPKHIEELETGEGWGTFEQRKAEHTFYYDFIFDWAEKSSLKDRIFKICNYDINFNLLQYDKK